MSLLNKEAYKISPDRLIYDGKHPVDAKTVQVNITTETAGELVRGQVLDCASGTYSKHALSGEVSAIVAETTGYASDDTDIIVPVYISGTFKTSEAIADPELTAADIEKFREKGIYLK